MKKEHSAADWSTRPLPSRWLEYAALDVEVLVELRDILAAELEAAGKSEWARQEFEHLRGFEPTPRGRRGGAPPECTGSADAARSARSGSSGRPATSSPNAVT